MLRTDIATAHPQGQALFARAFPSKRLLPAGATVLGASLLLVAAARIQVPFWPVPMTLQTLAVYFLAMTLGGRIASATVLLYLIYGAVGLPVFAAGGGLAIFFGPTGGYLLGFLCAAAAAGALADRGWSRGTLRPVCALLLAAGLIYLPGLLWLGIVTGWQQPILVLGLFPFIPAEIVKLIIARAALILVWRASKLSPKSAAQKTPEA